RALSGPGVRRDAGRLAPRDRNQLSLLPRRLAALRRVGVRRDRGVAATGADPFGPVVPTVGLDRTPVVRALPVPLAGDRLARPDAGAPARRGVERAPARRHVRRRDALLLSDRGADPRAPRA